MDSEKATIAQVMFGSASTLPGNLDLDNAHPKLRALEKGVRNELNLVDWPVVKGKLLQKLAEVLNNPFVDVLTAAWLKHDEIVRFCDEHERSAQATLYLTLAKHTIQSESHPSIRILVDGQPRGELSFTVAFGVDIEGGRLEIQDRKIKRLLTGTWQGFGSIAMEGSQIYKKSLEIHRIRGAIAFGEGIPID